MENSNPSAIADIVSGEYAAFDAFVTNRKGSANDFVELAALRLAKRAPSGHFVADSRHFVAAWAAAKGYQPDSSALAAAITEADKRAAEATVIANVLRAKSTVVDAAAAAVGSAGGIWLATHTHQVAQAAQTVAMTAKDWALIVGAWGIGKVLAIAASIGIAAILVVRAARGLIAKALHKVRASSTYTTNGSYARTLWAALEATSVFERNTDGSDCPDWLKPRVKAFDERPTADQVAMGEVPVDPAQTPAAETPAPVAEPTQAS